MLNGFNATIIHTNMTRTFNCNIITSHCISRTIALCCDLFLSFWVNAMQIYMLAIVQINYPTYIHILTRTYDQMPISILAIYPRRLMFSADLMTHNSGTAVCAQCKYYIDSISQLIGDQLSKTWPGHAYNMLSDLAAAPENLIIYAYTWDLHEVDVEGAEIFINICSSRLCNFPSHQSRHFSLS